MLTLIIPEQELYNEATNEFITIRAQKIKLEHSLVSISKWESKWEKPFFSKTNKTYEEIMDYIRCMTITQNVSENTYLGLTAKQLDEVNNYIDKAMTATTFSNRKPPAQDIITSELVYYWMTIFNIPVEFQKWHFNRLMVLIRICFEKANAEKMSSSEVSSMYRQINEARRKKYHTKG